ncbi:MAG: hypothetical protein MZV65_19850 [Chromatiales bacterium]|nr:hypothetical protein [Chromatiales bacterium]
MSDQPQPRSSGLSRHASCLRGGQAPVVRSSTSRDWAVLNLDDAFGWREIAADQAPARRGRSVTVSASGQSGLERFVWGENLELTPAGLRL